MKKSEVKHAANDECNQYWNNPNYKEVYCDGYLDGGMEVGYSFIRLLEKAYKSVADEKIKAEMKELIEDWRE